MIPATVLEKFRFQRVSLYPLKTNNALLVCLQVWFQNRRMKDKRQKMTLAWPCGDPILAAYVLQAAAASGNLPYPGIFAAAAAASAAAASSSPLGLVPPPPPPPPPPTTCVPGSPPPVQLLGECFLPDSLNLRPSQPRNVLEFTCGLG